MKINFLHPTHLRPLVFPAIGAFPQLHCFHSICLSASNEFHSLKVFCLTFTLTLAPALTSHALTPEEIARQAITHNPALQMAAAEIAAAKGARSAALAWPRPELSTQLGAKRNKPEDSSPKDGLSFSAALTLNIEWPGKRILRRAIADRNISLAELAYDQFKHELKTRAYEQAVRLAALQEISRRAKAVTDQVREVITALAQRPRITPPAQIEYQLLESAATAFFQQMLEIENRAQELQFELNLLRQAPSDAHLQVSLPTTIPPPPRPLKTLLQSASHHHPRVKLRALELETALLRLHLARQGAAPDLTLGPYYSREEAEELESTLGITFSLPLPLWDFNKGEIAQAQAQHELSKAALALAQYEAQIEIAKLHREWHRSKRLLEEITESRLKTAEETANLAASQFAAGAIPVQLYLDMQREYLSLAQTRLDALAQALASTTRMNMLTAPQQLPASKTKKSRS
ncbi:MAG: TolC family protein [Methylacidiphilales bacterium]|nr:TolC family protein [Candidatus Methylacidiphilales bacterium]MDW8350063.1 TolC family protein [Verrucomicrobiae bacterium]